MRERLIGAIVLIVIAAIMVPWLMSRAHHPGDRARDIASAAPLAGSAPAGLAAAPATGARAGPRQDAPVVARTEASVPAPAPASTLAQRRIPERNPRQQPVLEPLPPASSPVASAHETTASPAAHEPASADREAAPQPLVPPASTRGAQEVVRRSSPSPAPSEPATSAPAKPAPLGEGILHKGDWYVQVASFASHANAAQLAILLTRTGYHAFLSSHESGNKLLYRVRVGPYPSRDRAQSVAPGLAAVSGSKVLVRRVGGSGG